MTVERFYRRCWDERGQVGNVTPNLKDKDHGFNDTSCFTPKVLTSHGAIFSLVFSQEETSSRARLISGRGAPPASRLLGVEGGMRGRSDTYINRANTVIFQSQKQKDKYFEKGKEDGGLLKIFKSLAIMHTHVHTH